MKDFADEDVMLIQVRAASKSDSFSESIGCVEPGSSLTQSGTKVTEGYACWAAVRRSLILF